MDRPHRPAPLMPCILLIALAACGGGPAGGERTVAAADGTPIVYEVQGSGSPALVFVHCWACNRSFWRDQVGVFAEDHTVVTLDLPGHGTAGRERTAWTLEAFADDVARVVDDAGLERVVLVGHSMGGPVSLLAAARLGDRVAGVACVDALHDAAFEWPEGMAEQWIGGFEADYDGAMRAGVAAMVPGDSTLREWVAAEALLADREAMVGVMRQFPTFDLAAAFSAVEVPVRCINAAPYGPYSMSTAIETNRGYADFDAVVMDGVGHFLHIERPDEFNRHLRAVLTGMAGGVE